ncbi:TetR/AcrR family transcriptional regulator [Paraurantiacibacter namhicola]|uniref:Transcriptional regulator BetI n=1 Tax=Paraurantiacibacter namhicola TaxID=645517 RepID=A0A1C7D6W3_9SPHN|nr:TetR/AcrR family transcriptional regulator [Paraurantiacibacter namhicola]ANU07043.1 transcriptional regulator BetI [Paraurantiacibacter namhicola]
MSTPADKPADTKGETRLGRPTDPGKRADIIRAATRHFFDSGYAATSIEQVAATAEVSKVTIYNQFGGKPALFAAAVEAECERIRGHFSIDDVGGTSLREKLTTIGEAMSAFLSRPEMVSFERRVASETEREPGIGAAFLEAGPHRMKRAFSELLAAMNEAGEVEIEDTMLAAEQFAAMCKGMGDIDRRFGMPQDEERDRDRVVGAVEVFCRAYGKGNCD